MPNRQSRRHGDKVALGRWLHVEDANGNPYDIYLKDISGKDEFDFMQMMAGTGMANPPGLCDIFLEGRTTLVGISGLIWAQRRRYEKKLTPLDVMKTVNMATIETMELHDPEDEDEDEESPSDDWVAQGPPGFDGASGGPSPDSEPSTA
jgi:hypothetical protein